MIKILFIEPEIFGHHLDHIIHQCDFILSKKLPIAAYFLVNPAFESFLEQKYKKQKYSEYSDYGIKFIPLTRKEYDFFNNNSLIIGSFAKFLIMLKYIKKIDLNFIHFQEIDHLQLPFALQLPIPKDIQISGLLFRPSIHYNKVFGNRLSPYLKIINIRKGIFYKFMTFNRNINKIFCFDPYFVEYANTKAFKTNKFVSIPDPALFNHVCLKSSDTTEFKGKIIFLLFGALSRRKGCLKVLEAIQQLPDDIKRKSVFIFTGKLNDNIENQFISLKDKIIKNKNVTIKLENKFIPDEKLKYYIKLTDIVLIPYQKSFSGSSGSLFWAAEAGKPVISTDYGLLGKWVRDNDLGIVINPENPSELADAICLCVKKEGKVGRRNSMKKFVQNNTPERFAEAIFSELGFYQKKA